MAKRFIRAYDKGGVCIADIPADSVIDFQEPSKSKSVQIMFNSGGSVRIETRGTINITPNDATTVTIEDRFHA